METTCWKTLRKPSRRADRILPACGTARHGSFETLASSPSPARWARGAVTSPLARVRARGDKGVKTKKS
jgi:hypothetical protein